MRTRKDTALSIAKEAVSVPPDQFFSKVKVARDVLRARAEQIINEYMDIAAKAKDAGDYKTASKTLQWLIEHMPSDDEGTKVIDASVDKEKTVIASQAPPPVQIGIVVGGAAPKQIAKPKPKELPKVEVIDAD